MTQIDPATGVLTYESTDARGPMSTVLNLAQNADKTARLSDRQRLDGLEARFATLDTSTARTPVSLNTTNYEFDNLAQIWGETVPGLAVRRIGQQIIMDGAVNLKSTASSPGGLVIGDVPVGFRPITPIAIHYFQNDGGDVYRGIIRPNGNIRVVLAPTQVGTDLTFIVPPYFITA